ncbi:hypothetical protein P7C73_g732, partial [Tremellales sp. Uapishka_1]
MPPKRNAPTGGSQPASQRRRRRDDSEDEEDGAARGGLRADDLSQKARLLVRLALFNEYKKTALRRELITKTIIPDNHRAFVPVLEAARKILRQTCGMDLVEIRQKYKRGDEIDSQTAPAQQTQRKGKQRALNAIDEEEEESEEEPDQQSAAAASKGKKGPGTKVYILQNILPAELLKAANTPHPLPLFGDDDRRDNDLVSIDMGSLIRYETGENMALLGIRTLILCLIMVHDRVMHDDHLHAMLKRVNLQRDTILPFKAPESHQSVLTLDRYLELLERQNYLEKHKSNTNADGKQEIEWRWGSRELEFSEKAAAEFIAKLFFVDEEEDEITSDDEDVPRRNRNGQRTQPGGRRGERKLAQQKLKTDLEKAAGGPLGGQL